MENGPDPSHPPPHVLIYPFPIQGHVNSMLKLAELLAFAGVNVTFLNSEFNHERLVRFTNIQHRFANYPGEIHFQTITDGLPADHPRSGDRLLEMLHALMSTAPPVFKKLLLETSPSVDCVIADGIFGFVLDIGIDFRIPVILFRTFSACAFWAYFSILDLIEDGQLPIRGNEDMDRLITKVPGMGTFLRCRDLPSVCRVPDMTDPTLLMVSCETKKSARAQALILNTFEDLEAPILSQIRTQCPKIYSIGPLHEHLEAKLSLESAKESYLSSNSLWEVDRSCVTWLDNQPAQSVLYVSFGSVAVLTRHQFLEFWYGLVNSKKRFLWVIRPDSINRSDDDVENFPAELEERTKERGLMVRWVPQEEVLAHAAIGGFLTHSGWNSTLESIVAGVPMICWPYFADQQINSRFVSEVWKLGLDMKDLCDREIVEKTVNDLMVERREEFVRSAARMAELARKSVREGGSSYCNLNSLIEDIRLMSARSHDS